MLLALLAASVTHQAITSFDFHKFGPYDSAVPTPESILGYGPGEHETTYYFQEQVIQSIAKHAPGRVKYEQYGTSTEGKPLRVLIISSPKNMSRLEEIRKGIDSLANVDAKDPQTIQRDSPAVVWINECIHGDEPASFESGMWLSYTLASSKNPEIEGLLDKCVVIVNPSYNPDGHERFVVWYNSVATGNPDPNALEHHEPGFVYGRLNHYRFDMNRDRVAMSQQETREEVAEFNRWHPQVYVDQHGQVGTYFFPPASLSVNANVDRDRYNKMADILGRATAKSFDSNGFLYFIKDTFDLYYAGYLDSWTTLSGAIGMTHETDGSYSIREDRPDGSVGTLKQGIAKHFTSALAVIGAVADHRQEFLESFAKYKSDAVAGKYAPKPFLYAAGPESQISALASQLNAQGIRSETVSNTAGIRDGTSLWSGKSETVRLDPSDVVLRVDMKQPEAALAKAMLEEKSDFEPEFVKEQLRRHAQTLDEEQYPEPDPAEFYDTTAWSPVFARNLKAWWGTETSAERIPDWGRKAAVAFSVDAQAIGIALPPGYRQYLAALHLLHEGYLINLVTKPTTTSDGDFPPGTLFVMRERNTKPIDKMLDEKTAQSLAAKVLHSGYPEVGRQGPGSENVESLVKPNIGVLFGDDISPTQYSGIWFFLEKTAHIPFTPLQSSVLNRDLSKYSCLIFPRGRYGEPSDKLKDWVRNGGCLISLGGMGWAFGSGGFGNLEEVKIEKGQPGFLPGAFFRAHLDPRSFLSYGYTHHGDDLIDLAVPIEGNRFYKAKSEGGSIVALSRDPAEKKMLSGWEWPDDTERNLSGTVWVQDQPYGQGHVIGFAQDPTDRAMLPGLNQMLIDAILLGPQR